MNVLVVLVICFVFVIPGVIFIMDSDDPEAIICPECKRKAKHIFPAGSESYYVHSENVICMVRNPECEEAPGIGDS